MTSRTDRHNNPTAFTIGIAEQALDHSEYEKGESFVSSGVTYYTAKLIGDPVALTIKVINKVGFYTVGGFLRWVYIGIPMFVWKDLSDLQKTGVIQFMYHKEGGSEMDHLFQ